MWVTNPDQQSLGTYLWNGCSFGPELRCWQPPAASGLGGQGWWWACLWLVGAAGLCSSPPHCLFCGAAKALAWAVGFLIPSHPMPGVPHPSHPIGSPSHPIPSQSILGVPRPIPTTLTSGSGPGCHGSWRRCGRSGPSRDRETRVTSGAGLDGPLGWPWWPLNDGGEEPEMASPSG